MLKRLIFSFKADRLGPDLPLLHFFLFSKKISQIVCRKKFKSFGIGAEIRPHAYISGCSNIEIGARTVIRPGSFLYANTVDPETGGGITIGNDVLIGNGCHIYASNHIFTDISVPIRVQGNQNKQNVIIDSGAWIGSNSTILPGVKVGMNSVVGAGSVVTKHVPPFSVFAGNPAKLIKRLK